MHLFHQILVGIANSVDPDQTGPSHEVWSWAAVYAYAVLSQKYKILGQLLYLVWKVCHLKLNLGLMTFSARSHYFTFPIYLGPVVQI